MNNFGEKTFREIAKHYGFTYQRAEQICAQVRDCLKKKAVKLLYE